MLSIRTRLVLLTMLSIAAIFVISGASIYYFAKKNLLERFDQKLRVQAYSIMTATYQKKDRKVEVHFTDRFLHEFNSNQKTAFYQIWKNVADVVKRSDSLGEDDLPRKFGEEGEPMYWNLELPNRLDGRAIGVRYEPRVRGNREEDYNEGFELILVVATDLHEIQSSLLSLRNLLLFGGLATLTLSPFFVAFTLNSGLSPLKGLVGRMGKVDARSLETHFDEERLPEELRPIANQLNELFSRLQNSFDRERQFSADVAHELRTPIAAMLNISEVGLKWKEDDSKEDYEAIRSIASEMQRTVTQLMDLSRADSGELELQVEQVSLQEVIDEKWNRHKQRATDRNLSVSFDGLKDVPWEVDRSLFERIVDNLLENAVHYAKEGGDLNVKVSDENSCLQICNTCEGLSDADLEKVFDRFWRKDSSRSDSMHRGLGLPLTAAFCTILGLGVEVELRDSSLFEIRIRRDLESG